MVKADMLYQLDLRLREITDQPNIIFGRILVIVLGDIMQLKPCKGRHIWAEPRNPDFTLAYNVNSHWKQFDVVLLETNHRQGKDKQYADLLNRI